ncbi:MAG: histone deacetylase family protein [Pseudomonadota bacterium]|nr:MAG: histone deacetylase family protein [Pseudomonadota bacterium]
MFRIRKIEDDISPANRAAIKQVVEIMRAQFPRITQADLDKLPKQLHDPLRYKYRTILFVAEDTHAHVKGFALVLHMPDLDICYLELLSAAPTGTGGGVGAALYERAREETASLRAIGLFFECKVDEPTLVRDPKELKQNIARMRFYERYSARPIINNDYATPVKPGDENLFFLVFDGLGHRVRVRRERVRRVAAAVLERKYGELFTPAHIARIANSFVDDPIVLRAPRYFRRRTRDEVVRRAPPPIALIVNSGHQIHHVRERGYLEAPVRLSTILKELGRTKLFKRLPPKLFTESHITAVHDKDFVAYLRRACAGLPANKAIYPEVFPIRNATRPPKRLPQRAGYYCIDPFTPLSRNAYLAARGAVNCAMTGAQALLNGYHFAYALVRPPGHHAERRAFGGFCYFNSAAVAAHFLSSLGRVAVLDIDFHHGNGTENIFYERADVLTLSIHGDPDFNYPHFSGFEDEEGAGAGRGYNINYPLPEKATVERYRATLAKALARVREFNPRYLVLCLGLDTAKSDPTGTWMLTAADFTRNGEMIGAMRLPTLVVQEGGYRTRTLGTNARHFFEGLVAGLSGSTAIDKRRAPSA